jgi:hypothetical protein
MNRTATSIFVLVILSVASVSAGPQQASAFLFNIENAIRQNEPEWTLIDRYLLAFGGG